jgi:hypothetical protein
MGYAAQLDGVEAQLGESKGRKRARDERASSEELCESVCSQLNRDVSFGGREELELTRLYIKGNTPLSSGVIGLT